MPSYGTIQKREEKITTWEGPIKELELGVLKGYSS